MRLSTQETPTNHIQTGNAGPMRTNTDHTPDHRMDSSEANVLMSTIYGVLIVLLSGFLYAVLTALIKWGDTIGHTGAMMLFYQATFQIFFALLTPIVSISLQRKPMYKCKLRCRVKQMCGTIQQSSTDTSTINHHSTHMHPEGQLQSLQEVDIIEYIDDSDELSTPWLAIIISGFFGAISTYAYFKAIQFLPIGSAVTLTSLSCVISSLFGWLLFRDSITRYHVVAFILALNGALLISQPGIVFHATMYGNRDYNETHWTGSVVAMICGVMLGFMYLAVRFAKDGGTSPCVLMISHGTCSVLLALVLMFPFGFTKVEGVKDVLCIISIGFVGFVSQWTMTKGADMVIEGVSSLLRSSFNIICCFVFQIVLFGVYPDTLTIIGSLMTLAAIVIISMERSRDAMEQITPRSGGNTSLQSISCDADVL